METKNTVVSENKCGGLRSMQTDTNHIDAGTPPATENNNTDNTKSISSHTAIRINQKNATSHKIRTTKRKCFIKCTQSLHISMLPHEVMELGGSSWAWTMARSWSFAKFTGLDLVHGEVMELGENSGLGPQRGNGAWQWRIQEPRHI